jgi:threonylcarbamoyladenosine tRNA methylthiotransferase MtaB
MNSPIIAFHHFGCKVNFAEASSLIKQFKEKGYIPLNFHDVADVYVVSSCAVTADAEKKCRTAIRQARKANPDALIIVTGCFPELKKQELLAMPEVDMVLGNAEKFDLVKLVVEQRKKAVGHEIFALPSQRFMEPDVPSASGIHYPASDSEFIPAFSSGDRTRSFLKIQDGCDYFCAYCAIPYARGRSRSDTIQHVLKEAREIATQGINEIILTGINLGDFGKRNGETLSDLLIQLERETAIPRIRLSSIEPDLLTDEIIRIVSESEKILPHFHIPLQSGSDRVLNAMRRKYNRDLYSGRIRLIRELVPFACIAADVITGFPGETGEEFLETMEYLEHTEVSYLHVFSYSRRDNTVAANLGEPVDPAEIKRRSRILHQLSEQKKYEFYLLNRGCEVNVLFESDNKEGFMHGFSENYIKVKTSYRQELVNTIQKVTLEELNEEMEYVVIGH